MSRRIMEQIRGPRRVQRPWWRVVAIRLQKLEKARRGWHVRRGSGSRLSVLVSRVLAIAIAALLSSPTLAPAQEAALPESFFAFERDTQRFVRIAPVNDPAGLAAIFSPVASGCLRLPLAP